MNIKLPEKEHFTIDDLSKRWECDQSLITDYIETGKLRKATRTRYLKIPERSFIGYITKEDFTNPNELFDSSGANVDDQKYIGEAYKGLKNKLKKPNILPEYLYLIEGARYYIPNESPHLGLSPYAVCSRAKLFSGETILLSGLNGKQEALHCSYTVIPREERDRFERKYENSKPKIDKNANNKQAVPNGSNSLCQIDIKGMPPELKAATELWQHLYINEKKPIHLDHTKAGKNWLNSNTTGFTDTAKIRITRVCTPAERKNKQFE